MAYEYQSFATLGVNLNRQNYGALDISQVFTSQADLDYYLSKGTKTTGVSEYWYKDAENKVVPYPYEGQVLATVFDGVVKVYVLALDDKGEFVTQNVGDTSAVEASIKALEDLVGELPDTTDATTIVEYVNKKTEGIATTDSLAQLQRDVDAVEALVGVPAKEATDDAEAVVASGLHKALDDEVARAKAAEESLDSRLDTLEGKEDKDTTYSVASGEKILKLTGTEFSTVASLKYVKATETTNAKLQLLGIDSAVVSEIDASEFVTDGFLKNVELKESDVNHTAENGPYLVFTWNIDDALGGDEDTEADVLWVPVKDLIDVYTEGNGISFENNVISHANTSNVTNVTKTERTYVAGITFDDFGHVTAIETATETDPDYTDEFNNKVDKVANAIAGNLVALDADGNIVDSGKKVADFANSDHNHEELQEAIDDKLGEITTTANGGLKVTNKNQIDIDDSILFILDGGTAADLEVNTSNS